MRSHLHSSPFFCDCCCSFSTAKFVVPSQTTRSDDDFTCDGLCPGYIFGYGFPFDRVNWTDAGGLSETFDLGLGGDAILTYCLASNGKPHFIHGFSYSRNGTWLEPGLTEEQYGTEYSALPDNLAVNGSIALPYQQNYLFNGTLPASPRKDDLMELFSDDANYQGSNEDRFEIDELNSESGGDAATTAVATAMMLTTGIATSLLFGWYW